MALQDNAVGNVSHWRPFSPDEPVLRLYARSVAERLRTLELADGRTLEYATWGDPEGFPILSLHGTPGCRFSRWPDEDVYAGAGAYWVTHDRAGYGRSDRHHGRNVADEVADVAALADELGFDRFGVSGGSGGGPHVLACAALLPDRVVRALCIVGVAPFGDAGLSKDDWLAGMDPENVKEFENALAGEDVLTPSSRRCSGASKRKSPSIPPRSSTITT